MAKVNLTSIPTKSLLNVIIFGGGVVLFILLGILPVQRESKALDSQIEELETRIKEQQILTPVYESLLKKAQMKPPEGLNVVKIEKLKRNQTDEVAREFQEMAAQSNLQLVDFKPEIQSLIGDAQALKVNLQLKGEFINFQPFLVEVCQKPYLEKIEEMSIRSAKETKEIRLQLLLARE